MKSITLIPLFTLLFIMELVTAAEPKSSDDAAESEPVKCYEQAWGSDKNQGLGLNAGQAVRLCSGTTDADRVIKCFVKAWTHKNDGGLGLTAGQAVTLCKTNSLLDE